MKRILDRVTVTGADDSIQPEKLISLTDRFPFVEWGILLSKMNEGKNRFPTLKWMENLFSQRLSYNLHHAASVRLSGHICGRWVRDICQGNWTFLEDRPTIRSMFDRFQLNFHAQVHQIVEDRFVPAFEAAPKAQFIFQLDDINNGLLEVAREAGINAVPLFDTSGGIGRLPEEWPKAHPGVYTGYAGGLSPENLTAQLRVISEVCGNGPIWIDVETKVRSEDDSQFDLGKVKAFLEIAEGWVVEEALHPE